MEVVKCSEMCHNCYLLVVIVDVGSESKQSGLACDHAALDFNPNGDTNAGYCTDSQPCTSRTVRDHLMCGQAAAIMHS